MIWLELIKQAGVTLVALITVGLPLYVKVRRIDQQTTNGHAEAEFPNLRVQQDAQLDLSRQTHDQVLAVAEAQRGLERRMKRLERQTSDLRDADDATDDTLDRYQSRHARALADAVAERKRALAELSAHFERRVPELITAALASHVDTCPLRTPRH
ncbi:hypothetical protein [Sanguibacter sp. HDW7]|uniref:hypothetical protein n=1 Tax=Sanguibacter sp. HDW7 TaxID=2714931 RepID=UPI0014082FA2|nr:hypothetical protein [Sanguibacter sp. HDW7]QIK83119.1 hypothetical protein G7063_05355 [Sanguibacter sp. HDW7]